MAAQSTKRRQVIGNDPLDALLSPRAPAPKPKPVDVVEAPPARRTKRAAPTTRPAKPTPSPAPAAPASKSRSTRATFHLPTDLLDQARDAVVALSGPPVRLTLAGMVQTAIRTELERLEKAHNKGKPFPRRDYDLKGGRPIGS